MMQRKPLVNKNVVIAVIIVLFVLCVGIVLLVNRDSNETNDKDTHLKTEQSKGDADSTDNNGDDKGKDNTTLEVLEPDVVAPENSSDASGAWDNVPESNDRTDSTVKKEDERDELEKDEDVLEDDITWGNIY